MRGDEDSSPRAVISINVMYGLITISGEWGRRGEGRGLSRREERGEEGIEATLRVEWDEKRGGGEGGG